MKTMDVLEKVLRGKRVRPATVRHYREVFTSLANYEPEFPVSGVMINEWLATLDGYADMTVRNMFAYLNSAGKYMKKAYGLVNPCETADRPKVAKKRRRYFTAGELVRVIKACRFEQDKALILTLVDSTCRIGELQGLEVKNVGESWLDVSGKTGERRYRLDKVICDKLKELGDDDGIIFRGRDGGHASISGLKHRVRRVIREAGITGSKVGAHTLRHSGASLVAQETGSALAVKALLQHDKIDTSMEYIHDAEDVIRQRISPLRLVGQRVFGENGDMGEVKQIEMAGVSERSVVAVEDEADVVVDLLDEQFPEIKDGTVVRSRFMTEDLRLIRRIFIRDIRSGMAGSDEVKGRELFKRMLRKVK